MSGLTAELVVSRSVRDTAAILDAVHGAAPGDPYVAPPPGRPYVEELDADPGPLRIGLIVRSFTEDPVHPEAASAARDAARLLESMGHAVEERSGEEIEGLDLVDTFLTRWMAGQAATLAELQQVVGREIHADDVEPLTWALAEEGRRRSAGEYLLAVGRHQLITRIVAGWFESGLDLLLTPTTGESPPPLGTFDDSGEDPLGAIHRARITAGFTALLNATGHPAISLPLHWSPEGLPIGVQLVAPYGREDVLIRVAAQLERARPWSERVPETSATVT
jgi:amidase